MSPGDILVEVNGPNSGHLVSGSGSYSYAICVDVDPFTMVSGAGDMMWTRQKPEHFKVLRAATEEESLFAFDRYFDRGRWAPNAPEGYDEMLLTEGELTHLIRESANTRLVECSFGPGWIRLKMNKDTAWAIILLRKYRKLP